VSASVSLPLHHKVEKFSSGTGSPGWSRKKGHKTVVVSDFLLSLLWNKDHKTSVFVVTVLFLLRLLGGVDDFEVFFTPHEQLLAPIGVIFLFWRSWLFMRFNLWMHFFLNFQCPPIGKTVKTVC